MTNWVLVASPNEQRQRLVRQDLETAGFEVETVGSVDAALALLSIMRPSLIVVDDELAEVERLQRAARHGVGVGAIPLLSVAQAVA